MGKIKIILADDHQILLDGLSSILELQEDICVAGIYTNGLAMYADIKNTMPCIALVDINMPGLNGHELTLKIKKEFPEIKVIALSMFDDITHIMQLIKAGASGYLFKNTNNDELLKAIRAVADGGTWFSAGVTDKVAAFIKAEKSRQYDPVAPALTGRELEILKLVAMEYSNAKIADSLFISERTVETHRKNMLRKTNHKNMVGLLKYAFDNHLL
jgi:DNA-binding NarL/FixJ family response regulator